MRSPIQKITPFLWFDDNAEEAANHYVSIFRNSRVTKVTRYGEAGSAVSGRPVGSVMTVEFELEGQKFVALNGGPVFAFSPSISFAVSCESQRELDDLWDMLSEGGKTQECGWLTDKYGVTWQIVPAVLAELLSDPDPAKSDRVTQELIRMKKLDIAALKKAYEREPVEVRERRRAG